MNEILSQSRPRHNIVRTVGWGTLVALLLVPAIAMLLTGEVNWGPGDFIVMGGLLLLLGLAVEFAFVKARGVIGRATLAGIALAAFLLVWAELAVGIFH